MAQAKEKSPSTMERGKERKKSIKTHHHDPGDKVKFFDDVKQIERQQDAGYPESAHGAKVEPVGSRVVIHFRHHNANEAQNVENLRRRHNEMTTD